RLPMFDLSLFRDRVYAGGLTTILLIGVALFGNMFYNSLFFQDVLGYSPLAAGALFLPTTLVVIVLSPLAGRLSDRIGSRGLVSGGMVVSAIGLTLLAQLDQ